MHLPINAKVYAINICQQIRRAHIAETYIHVWGRAKSFDVRLSGDL